MSMTTTDNCKGTAQQSGKACGCELRQQQERHIGHKAAEADVAAGSGAAAGNDRGAGRASSNKPPAKKAKWQSLFTDSDSGSGSEAERPEGAEPTTDSLSKHGKKSCPVAHAGGTEDAGCLNDNSRCDGEAITNDSEASTSEADRESSREDGSGDCTDAGDSESDDEHMQRHKGKRVSKDACRGALVGCVLPARQPPVCLIHGPFGSGACADMCVRIHHMYVYEMNVLFSEFDLDDACHPEHGVEHAILLLL